MMKKRIMIVALAGAVLAGCSEDFMSEAVLQPEVPTVRLAVDHAETRASLDGVSVSWEAGDKISVNGTTYTLQGSESEGWYVDVAEAASYEAVYPASAVRSDGLLMLPAVQHYTAGSFDAAAHLMTASAQSVGEGLQFRNQCALLKLSLTGAATVERIVLTGNNGEYLAGPGGGTIRRAWYPTRLRWKPCGGYVSISTKERRLLPNRWYVIWSCPCRNLRRGSRSKSILPTE
ncbi:MAG: fimbrillin family protein [Alistipes inops]